MRAFLIGILAAAGCTDEPAPPATTQLEAASLLAEIVCDGVGRDYRGSVIRCEVSVVRGWCASADDCAEPVDEERFDACLMTAGPSYLEPHCWLLFR